MKSKLHCLNIFLTMPVENEAEQSPQACGDGCGAIIILLIVDQKWVQKRCECTCYTHGFQRPAQQVFGME